jgi:hypothetical protein
LASGTTSLYTDPPPALACLRAEFFASACLPVRFVLAERLRSRSSSSGQLIDEVSLRAPGPRIVLLVLLALVTVAVPSLGYADEVLDWNRIACRAVTTAPAPSPPLALRILAITHAAMFDAYNGIERRFSAIHVPLDGPVRADRGASRRAAVVQAAFAVLSAEYPAQIAALSADRTASLATIAEGGIVEDSMSIQRGIGPVRGRSDPGVAGH